MVFISFMENISCFYTLVYYFFFSDVLLCRHGSFGSLLLKSSYHKSSFFSMYCQLRFPVIFHRRHAAFLFKQQEKMVIAAESAELADVADRQSLQKIFFAQINPGMGDIGVQRNPRTLFKFPGNMFPGNKKFLLQLFQGKVFRQMLADIFKDIVNHQHFPLMTSVHFGIKGVYCNAPTNL